MLPANCQQYKICLEYAYIVCIYECICKAWVNSSPSCTVDLMRGMRPKLNLKYSFHIYNATSLFQRMITSIFYQIQSTQSCTQMQVHKYVCLYICKNIHVITNFCCRLLSETLTSSSSFRVSHSRFFFS